MTNSTETFWDVDGTSLQTYAWNITTLGGDRLAPPPLRGSSVQIPYMPGTRYLPQLPDARTITLGMWVIGASEDGTIPTEPSVRRMFEYNWSQLRKLLWRPRKQFTLTKRFWLPDAALVAGGIDTSVLPKEGDWTLLTASAKGSFAGGLEPTMSGPGRAAFTVDIRLDDPFFYSDEISIPFTTQTGGSYPGPNRSVVVLGDDRTMNIEIDFEGPLTSPRVSNLSEEQSLWVQYGAVVPDDESATVRARNFSATHYPSGDPYKVSGNVQHAGDRYWMYLEPGVCDLSLDAQAGTGVANLRYRPAWF